MNKKFLSAILFGALMVSSTGTFVSCKDYDDDIKDLQEQINSNKDAITALQKLVGAGKWVTSISSIENGFTVTMSDGTTTSITSIKGADGKNGTEWTIGEDGFWYKDGEKTASQAVGEDGENGEDGKAGVTAPSPKINADGFWVVYEWDAAKGEFVEKTTEISAQGTSAYVVAKDGVYILHIADETGKFQDITLPATSDSFVVEVPAAKVTVNFEYATWAPQTAKDAYKALLAKYPAIGKIEKEALVKQGGHLPLLVTPASVELTDKMAYELIDVKGKAVDIKVSTPTRGLPANTEMDAFEMVTRNASTNGFWSLQVTPALNEKGTEYITEDEKALSLTVTNEKGTTVNTQYGYLISSDEITEDVAFDNGDDGKMTKSADYASTIDLFGLDKDGNSPIALKNEYLGYCFVELTDPADAEKYGLSIDENNILTIEKMPNDLSSIDVKVKVTALGLNGSVMAEDATITVNQKIASDAKLADKVVTLAAEEDAEEIRWKIEDLKFSALQLKKFVGATKTITLTREDKNGKYIAFYDDAIKCYDAKGNETSKYTDAVTFGFSVSGVTEVAENVDLSQTAYAEYIKEQILPKNYTITLTAKDGDSQFFTADATMKVSNPGEAAIKLVAEFVENKTLQAVGVVDPSKTIEEGRTITYNLTNGIVASDNIVIDKYIDVDYETYSASGNEDKKDMASQNWIITPTESELTIYAYDKEGAKTDPAKFGRLGATRNIRIEYHLFGNKDNKEVFEFPMVVKSAVYSDKPETVITVNKDKLSAVFGGTNNTNLIKVADITKAVFAAGPDKGKNYDLFNKAASTTPYTYNNYETFVKSPVAAGTNDALAKSYVVTSTGLSIAIDKDDMSFFGYNMDEIHDAQNGKSYFLINEAKEGVNRLTWSSLWTKVKGYSATIKVNGKDVDTNLIGKAIDPNNGKELENTTVLNDAVYKAIKEAAVEGDKDALEKLNTIDMFKKYAAKTSFVTTTVKVTVDGAKVNAAFLDGEAVVSFVDEATGKKFAKINSSTITAELATGVSPEGDKVTVPFKLTINDAWGKTMVYQFEATFTTK